MDVIQYIGESKINDTLLVLKYCLPGKMFLFKYSKKKKKIHFTSLKK